jgi:hypothetical protein
MVFPGSDMQQLGELCSQGASVAIQKPEIGGRPMLIKGAGIFFFLCSPVKLDHMV